MSRILVIDEEGISALVELAKGTGRTIIQSLKTEKSVRKLARDLNIAPSTVCYHLDRLEKLRLVEKVERERGDRRVKLYKATGISIAYLILLNFPDEEKDTLKKDLSDLLSKKSLIVKDIISLFLAIGAGLGIWALQKRAGIILQGRYPEDLITIIVNILPIAVLLTTLIYLQRTRISRALRRIKSAFS